MGDEKYITFKKKKRKTKFFTGFFLNQIFYDYTDPSRLGKNRKTQIIKVIYEYKSLWGVAFIATGNVSTLKPEQSGKKS